MLHISTKTVAIVGQGYVGLPLAMAALSEGWHVIGVDTSESKVDQLNSGVSPVEDISDATLRSALSGGKYKATTGFEEVNEASIVVLCVPTPLYKDKQPNIEILRGAAASVAPFLSSDTLLISESTSYPGTLREVIIPTIIAKKSSSTTNLYFACAPERINPGDNIWNQKNTPRLVGAIDSESMLKAKEFYESICDKVIEVSKPEIAEAAKLLENTFRLVNIALVNEFTQLMSMSNVNVNDVIDAASTKPYGFMPFRPGVGVGGHCIPVDPLYLTWWARENGMAAEFVESAESINSAMPKYVAERAFKILKDLYSKPRILILGVAYKPGVADVRETPVSELRQALLNLGAEVRWHDPLVTNWENTLPTGLDWECDLAILATNQPGMRVTGLLERRIPVLDCTNSLKPAPGVSYL
jgi:UDP-N-acetyl-D-glucosamine dehydrogenase